MSPYFVCTDQELNPGQALALDVPDGEGSVKVAIVRAEDGEWFAISNLCSHGQVALSDGEVEGCTIECWLHGSTFDLRTGKPTGLPATQAIPTYPVIHDGQRILVDLEA